MERKIVYFDKVSPDNTETTLSIAKQRADELGIQTIVIASTYGATAVRAVDVFKGSKVIVVGHSYGHREPNSTPFTDENRKNIESKGGGSIFCPGSVCRARADPPPSPCARDAAAKPGRV
ncbi:hypothetical protein ACFLU1_05800 [Chloroflexota bacterium]